MCLKVGGGSPVLIILVAMNTLPTFPFALLGSTLEKMIFLAILISDSDLGIEKTIDRGVPSGFEVF